MQHQLLDQLPVPLSRKQFQSVVESDARVNFLTGSIRSGKTVASLLRWLIYVAMWTGGGELVVIGRTRESIARNIFGPLMDVTLFGPLAKHVTYTAGAPTAKIFGKTIHVLGASDARSEAVLRGLTCGGAYVDELTLVSQTFWTTLLGRLSVPGAQIFATTNPDSPAHWVKKNVLDRAVALGYRVFQFRLEDNEWLNKVNPEYIAQIKREYVGLWYRRFILGEWVQAEGAIYDMWDPARHVVKAATVPDMDRVLALGIDYGTTNPTRGLLVGFAQEQLWTLDEWAPPTGYTDAAQSLALRRWMATREPTPWRNPEWVFVDPAAASFKVQLFADGLNNVGNGANSVLPGIRTIASLLATDRLKVVGENCPNLVEQIPGYSWDAKATAKGEDAPIKQNDHEVDGWRYAIHTSRALWRDSIPTLTASPTAPGADEDDLREAA